jgi:hypothetical protein
MSTTLLGVLLTAGCQRPSPSAPAAPPPPSVPSDAGDGGSLQFTSASFDDLYPIFLKRKVPPGPKAALWRGYVGKWVRWTGTLVSFTQNGITLKQLKQTITFDVSLWLEAGDKTRAHERFRPGDRVSYIGQLDTYDDVFRTLYLVHGRLLP